METKQHFPLASYIVVEKKKSRSSTAKRMRGLWLTVLGVCGVGGLMSGITGLILSLLTACGIVTRTRTVGITVSILIVVALGLLLTAAHAMDRLQNIHK